MREFYKEKILSKVKQTLESFRAKNKDLVDSGDAHGGDSEGARRAVPLRGASDSQPLLTLTTSAQILYNRIARRASKKLSESLLRIVQLYLLSQEVSKFLMDCDMDELERLSAVLSLESNVGVMEDTEESAETAVERRERSPKESIIQGFLESLMSRCIRKRGPTDEIVCEVMEEHLDSALDKLFMGLQRWKEMQVTERTRTMDLTVRHLTSVIHQLERQLSYLENRRDLEKRAIGRRVQIELADRNYELLLQADELGRRVVYLEGTLQQQERELRQQVQQEFQEKMQRMDRELMVTRGKFDEYRTYLYREMQNNLMEIKKEAMLKMVESENAPLELKRKALKIARFDDEISRLKEENLELKRTILKARMLGQLRQNVLRSHFERLLHQSATDHQKATREFWSNREKVEERENLLRQQLLAAQNSLNAAEIELEQLRKDLQLQMKNKQQLVHWKVKNAHLLSDLESRVKKYERWKTVDVDKLLLELEKKDSEIRQLSDSESKTNRRSALLEGQKDKEIHRLRRLVDQEQTLKQQAFDKLAALREEIDADPSDVATVYRSRYMGARGDLETALQEVESLRSQLTESGLPVPEMSILFQDNALKLDDSGLPEIPDAAAAFGSSSFLPPRPPALHRPQTTSGASRPRDAAATSPRRQLPLPLRRRRAVPLSWGRQ